jgi:RNA repair pathway DNA polymerase beta family
LTNKVFDSVVGSTNYNLVTPSSDVDRKLFVFPTFDDLYNTGEKIKSKSKHSEDEDVEVHDIRKLPQMLWKSNVNFIEVLFTLDMSVGNKEAVDLTRRLVAFKEEIARMNLPYLYDACYRGMFMRKKKDFERDRVDPTKRAAALKHAHAAIRIGDFLLRYHDNGFDDFGEAIFYSDIDPLKDTLMDMKNGSFFDTTELERTAKVINDFEKGVEDFEVDYKSQAKDEEMNQRVQNWVREAVKLNVKKELEEK